MHWTRFFRFATPRAQNPTSRTKSRLRLRFDTLEDRTVPVASFAEGFVSTPVAAGLASPTAMEIAPDGRVFVAQQGGSLRVIENGALLPTPFLTVGVDAAGERGLLGVTFDPNFAANHFVYIYYTTPATTSPAVAAHNRISRFTASAANGNVSTGSETILVELDGLSAATNHNGGAIHFGNDGKLYVGVGENGNPANAQSLGNRLGKVLRYEPGGAPAAGNPTTFPGIAGATTGANQAIFAVGFRNPFTFAVKPGTSTIFINDVGQSAIEEIDPLVAGANYGWPIAEGPSTNPNFTNPIFSYPHGAGTSAGNAISGGAFYNPAAESYPPGVTGQYFFADFVNGWIRRLNPADGSVALFGSDLGNLVDLKVDSTGHLLYLTIGGQLNSVSFAPTQRQQFVQATYADMLGRPPSLADLDTWTGVMTAGGQGAVAKGILRSNESLGRIVDGMYTYMLGRAADPGGRAAHVNFLANGNSIEVTLANLAGSAEFAARATALVQSGNSDTDFVRALYSIVLGRTPSNAEVNSWLGQLPSKGRVGVALNFTRSAEFLSASIASIYGPSSPPPFLQTLLNRASPPSAGEVNGWVNTGLDLLSIEQAFLSSVEYFNNA